MLYLYLTFSWVFLDIVANNMFPLIYPIGSMYGRVTYLWMIFRANVGRYFKHLGMPITVAIDGERHSITNNDLIFVYSHLQCAMKTIPLQRGAPR